MNRNIDLHRHCHVLRDGRQIEVRMICPDDKELLASGLSELSPESRYFRFFRNIDHLSSSELRYLTEIDHWRHCAWGAVEDIGGLSHGLGIARYVRLSADPDVAEAAVTIIDSAQGLGLGTLLLGHLLKSAAQNGVKTFRAYVLAGNSVMVEMLRDLGAKPGPIENGFLTLDMPALPGGNYPDSPVGALMKAVAQEDWGNNTKLNGKENEMFNTTYGLSKALDGVDYTDAVDRVVDALKGEGFGVLTEIDVKTTLKTKLDVDFCRYIILGACNPPLAHRSLQAEPAIGLLLPCNVVVAETDDGGSAVTIAKPREMFKIVDNPDMRPIVQEVEEKLQRVLARL